MERGRENGGKEKGREESTSHLTNP
eukprot:COSAG03_NODE_26654_length_256_cov_0.000000_1_plen_24_part_10